MGRKKLTALSLFSGAGGMDIGIEAADFHILAQVEMDKYCCETLREAQQGKNGSGAKIYEGDIRQIDPSAVRKDLRLRKRQLDLLFGGPPCQSFSLAGKQKGLSDERGMLLFEMVRFAKEFQPRVILIEQVKGLLSSKGAEQKRGEVFDAFISAVESAGYIPKWKTIVAADFGVPQMRERLFIVATRRKNGFLFPNRTHAPREECSGLFSYAPYVAVKDAIKSLGAPMPKTIGTTFYNRADSHVDVTPARDRERIKHVPEGSYLAAQTHLGEELIRGLGAKDTTKYLRLNSKKPSNTLRCGEIFYHPKKDRYLTPREYMRIHGYPDSYRLKGPIRSRTGSVKNLDQHRQVANSVPPPLANALGGQIRACLLAGKSAASAAPLGKSRAA